MSLADWRWWHATDEPVVDVTEEARERIVEVLRLESPLSQRALCAKVGGRQDRTRREAEAMAREGLLTIERKSNAHLYSLATP